jgi:DNA-binding SARP family transcriptional activator
MELGVRELEPRRLPAAWRLHQWPRPAELAVDDRSAAATGIRLRLLAAPSLMRADGTLIALERKDAALLALLAVDGPTPRARAAALLWPDSEPQKARNSLRQRLFRLRRAAGCDVVDDGSALALAGGVQHDLSFLHRELLQDPTAAPGDLLGSFGYEDCSELEDWLRAARERFRVQRRDALSAAAAQEEAAGHIARALVYAERLVSDEPLSEQAHRLLMRLHYRRGDRSAALAAYTRCEQWLRSELGAVPGTETRELALLVERAGELPGNPARRLPTALMRPPVLVGREPQWRSLEAAWEQRRVAVLIADAGMGKSRLLGDFAQHHGVPVVGARPGDQRVPYALLTRVLRALLARPGKPVDSAMGAVRTELARVLPELGEAPTAPMVAARFRQAVAHVLKASQAAGLTGIALDDVHFADSASAEWLPDLAASGLRCALAVRGAEMPAPMAAWQRAETGDVWIDVPLPPLTESDVRRLLETLALDGLDAAALAAPLARHTGGNPYFVLETLGAVLTQPDVGAQLPTSPSVGALIEQRLAQLSPSALRLVRVAALAGADFTAALAAHVLQSHPLDLTEAWSELERSHVLSGNGFAHDLVREVTARAVPEPISQLLHRGIAEYLDAQDAPAARIAQHFADAGQWQWAATFHLRAADAARRASRRADEVEQREAAIACFDRAGAADAAFDARCASIESLLIVKGVEQAQTVIEGMLAVARTDAQRVAALTARANAALLAADHVSGVSCAREALALADGLGQPWLRFEASRLLAIGLSQQGCADAAEALLTPFEGMVESEGSIAQRDHYWSDLAYVLNSARRLRRTAAALARAIDCAREQGDLAELAMLTTNLATVYGNLGMNGTAYEHALRARALQVELGRTEGPIGGVIEAHVGLYAGGRGLYGIALEAFDRALETFRRDGQTLWIAVCSNNLATTLIDLGQYGRARKVLEYRPPGVEHVSARGACLAGRIARLLSSSPTADLERSAAELARSGDYYIGTLLELERSESMDAGSAVPVCDAVAVAAEEREFGGIALKARVLAARAALQAGNVKTAADRWDSLAAQLDTQQPADSYPLLPAAVGVEILQASGQHERALTLLAAALSWLRLTALPQVPDAFRDSFLTRNPVNRALLTAESRLR